MLATDCDCSSLPVLHETEADLDTTLFITQVNKESQFLIAEPFTEWACF